MDLRDRTGALSARDLVDALRHVVQWKAPTRVWPPRGYEPDPGQTAALATMIEEARHVHAHPTAPTRRLFSPALASRIVRHALGPSAIDAADLASAFALQPDNASDEDLLALAVLLGSGLSERVLYWLAADALVDEAADWIVCIGPDLLAGMVDAGWTSGEIAAVFDDDAIPDVESLRVIAALRN